MSPDVGSDATADSEPLPVEMSLLVISDLHAVGPDKGAHWAESHLGTPDLAITRRSPLERFKTLAVSEGLRADQLICCGDITNRAGMDGLRFAWTALEDLASSVGARAITVVPGNHDIDSTNALATGDPWHPFRSVVQTSSLLPRPVTAHRLERDHFEIYLHAGTSGDEVPILALDTNGPNPEVTRGRRGEVALATVDALEAALHELGTFPFGVAVCHHHPHKHGEVDIHDYSECVGGPETLNALERSAVGSWLLIHGHKHHPRIAVLDSRVTIFAAGSFSGTFAPALQPRARNHVYHLEILRDPRLPEGHGPVGRFSTWDWHATDWRAAVDGFGIPSAGGFGATDTAEVVASKIAGLVDRGGGKLSAEVVHNSIPELNYLPPVVRERVERVLEERYEIQAIRYGRRKRLREFGREV